MKSFWCRATGQLTHKHPCLVSSDGSRARWCCRSFFTEAPQVVHRTDAVTRAVGAVSTKGRVRSRLESSRSAYLQDLPGREWQQGLDLRSGLTGDSVKRQTCRGWRVAGGVPGAVSRCAAWRRDALRHRLRDVRSRRRGCSRQPFLLRPHVATPGSSGSSHHAILPEPPSSGEEVAGAPCPGNFGSVRYRASRQDRLDGTSRTTVGASVPVH